MNQKLNKPVSVILAFDCLKRKVAPLRITFCHKTYPTTGLGLHHTYRHGSTLYHVFSVVSDSNFFRLVLNTDNLFWTLEETSDGLPR